MSIGTQTWENKNINLGFPLINLNFQSLENRQTCQHKHTQMQALGTGAESTGTGSLSLQPSCDCALPAGGSCNQPWRGLGS